MVETLSRRGMRVTLVEYLPSVLTTLDPRLGALVGEELDRNGVTVATGVTVETIDRRGGRLVVTGSGGFHVKTDLVLVATGVRPDAGLAAAAGVEVGRWGAIRVNRAMKTLVVSADKAPSEWRHPGADKLHPGEALFPAPQPFSAAYAAAEARWRGWFDRVRPVAVGQRYACTGLPARGS